MSPTLEDGHVYLVMYSLMSRENDITISAYNQNVRGYIDGSPQTMPIPVKDWLRQSLQDLPLSADLLEIGSGFGRDAEYIEKKLGYKVERTDASREFVGYLTSLGYAASELHVVRDRITKSYDMILANAVFLHLTRVEAKQACENVYQALRPKVGRFSLSLLQGEGDIMTIPTQDKTGASRYFCYWSPEQADALLRSSGFDTVEVTPHTEPGDTATWLHIIAKK